MSPYIKALPLILGGISLNAFAQIAIKKAVTLAGMEWNLPSLVKLFTHPWMILCLTCYAISVVLWAGAAHLVEMNYAYPFMALGFLAVALMSRAFLGEHIPPMRWVALVVIVIGVGLQFFSGSSPKPKPGSQEFQKPDR